MATTSKNTNYDIIALVVEVLKQLALSLTQKMLVNNI